MQNNLIVVTKFPNPVGKSFDKNEWEHDYQNSNVIINCSEREIYFPEHWGPLSLKACLSGCEYYVKDHSTYKVHTGNYLLLNEGTEYSSFIKTNRSMQESYVDSFTINFNWKFENEVWSVLSQSNASCLDCKYLEPQKISEQLYPFSPELKLLMNKIVLSIKSGIYNSFQLNEYLYQLLGVIYKERSRINQKIEGIKAEKKSTKIEIYTRITRVKDYMDSCYSEDIDLSKLSEVSLMSPFHLLREFKKNFQITPYQYLTKVRLLEAHKLLTQNESVFDTLIQVGYKDISSFSKLYKRTYGIPPSTEKQNKWIFNL